MKINLSEGQEFTKDGIAPDMGALQAEHAEAHRELTALQDELRQMRVRECAAINKLNAIQYRIDRAVAKLKAAAPPGTNWTDREVPAS